MRDDSPAHDEVTDVELIDGRKVRIHYVVNPRARRVSVRIDPQRRIAVATAPSKRQLRRAAEFAAERASWIAQELANLPAGVAFVPFAQAPLRGVMHELLFEQGRGAPRVHESPPQIVVPAPDPELFGARVRRFFRAAALEDLTARVHAHAAALEVKPQRVQVKDTRSRWGSCSTDGALSFSWRVVCAPPFVLDYLAAHEVAHLREMNHGPRFWALVRKICPEMARGRAWLHRHGMALHAIGSEAARSLSGRE